MIEIDIDPSNDESRRLWSSLGDLVALLPPGWVLIGGLMVQLHALEWSMGDVRATTDIDVLGQARPQGALVAIDRALRRHGFTPDWPDDDGYAHRYVRDALVVDVVAPDGMKPAPQLGTGRVAVEVPGGSQALVRQEEVTVRLGGNSFTLRRPTILGAILIKARSLMVHHDLESQREDLLMLLSLVQDPRAMARELTNSERSWLRTARERLAFDRPANVGSDRTRRARLALRLLIGEG
ncbi:MAG TPA: hypothetical protein VFY36_07860 [Solirubrobacteraceae bacterium]|nr:hypothetical protein [Solirubrobacteraceae bacterium]